MDISKIKVGSIPDKIYAIIEIPYGSSVKYELDKESGAVFVDRVMASAVFYPANYGFIPRTYEDDGDPLDVLVLCSEEIIPGALVECKPIGVLVMSDDKGIDSKIIAVPLYDPNYNTYNDIKDLPRHLFDEIKHFFTYYKTLEGKSVMVENIDNKDKAIEVILRSKMLYLQKFLK